MSDIPLHSNLVDLPTGVSIEAHPMKSPRSKSDSNKNKLAVCLHPWSWLGGNMDDPVLHSLLKPLQEKGYHVLRYNSRGVGGSTGRSSFTGFSEGQDLEALIQWGLKQIQNVTTVVIIGYSHGSLIASLHPVLPAPVKTVHILLSYPLGPRGFLTLFKSSTYEQKLKDLVQDNSSNVLVVFGDKDEFTSISNYKIWAEKLEGCGQLTIFEIPGTTHFWRGEGWNELERRIKGYLE